MILCFRSANETSKWRRLNCKFFKKNSEFLIFFSWRWFSSWRRWILNMFFNFFQFAKTIILCVFFNRCYNFWAFKISKKLFAFWFFYLENHFLNDRLHVELNFFDQSFDIIDILKKRWNDENAQTKCQFFVVDFLSSFFFFDKRLFDFQCENRRY